MPLSHVTKVFAVQDASIAPLLTDTSLSAPTYGASIDVPGITSIAISGTVKAVTLRGDNTLLDSAVTLTGIQVKVGHSLLSLDALACMTGVVNVDTGTTPAQQTTSSLLTTSRFGYFQLRGRSASALDGSGDLHVVFGKLQLADWPDGAGSLVEEDYAKCAWTANAIPTKFDKQWYQLILNETAIAAA